MALVLVQAAVPPTGQQHRSLPIIFPLLALLGLVSMLGGGQAGSVAAIVCGFFCFGAATVGSTIVRFLEWCNRD